MARSPRHTLLVAAVAAACFVSTAPTLAGTYFKAVTRVENAQGKTLEDTEVEGWVQGDEARIAFLRSSNPWTKAGTYLVTEDGGRTIYQVNPKEETYSQWDLNAMIASAGAMMNSLGDMVKMEVTDPHSEILLDEKGPDILGYPTRHLRRESGYSMEMRMMGMKRGQTVTTTQELWVTDRLKDAGFGAWLRKDPPKSGNEELDELFENEILDVEGMVVKSKTVSKSVGSKKGRETVTTSETEVTALREEDTSGVSYTVPEGFEPVPMMPGL